MRVCVVRLSNIMKNIQNRSEEEGKAIYDQWLKKMEKQKLGKEENAVAPAAGNHNRCCVYIWFGEALDDDETHGGRCRLCIS